MIVSAANSGLVLGQNAPGYERSPGLHMSTIYGDLYAKLEPKRYGKRPDDRLPLEKWEMGMAMEEDYERAFADRNKITANPGEQIYRPGEFITKHDPKCPNNTVRAIAGTGMLCWICGAGIAFSPDLFIVNGSTRLGEIKCTWMTAKAAPISQEQADAIGFPRLANNLTEFDSRFDKWFTQIKAYCYHLQLTEARLIVFFVNGNYKPPSPIPPLAWDLTFTAAELQEEWMMLLNHAKAEGMLAGAYKV